MYIICAESNVYVPIALCVLAGLCFLLIVSDDIPAPVNVTLDTHSKTLQWSHALLPPKLPSDFILVRDYNVSYQVYRYGGGSVTSVNTPGSYLNLENVLNECEEQKFTVQAVINDELYSDNSSVICLDGKLITTINY